MLYSKEPVRGVVRVRVRVRDGLKAMNIPKDKAVNTQRPAQ